MYVEGPPPAAAELDGGGGGVIELGEDDERESEGSIRLTKVRSATWDAQSWAWTGLQRSVRLSKAPTAALVHVA